MTAMTKPAALPSAGASTTLFIATICAGSFLLFLVQPMIARMALPRLGGAPAVWNSAMLVYQALLLGGYAYAHWLSARAVRTQATIHLILFAVAALMLPIGLIAVDPPADATPFVWVPWLLIASIGPLFFAVAAQAPLMQRWFTLAGGGDPYPLYAASNLGSFGGLLAYPLIVEPLLPVAQQSWLWSGGYVALFALVAVSAWQLPRSTSVAVLADSPSSAEPSVRELLYWMMLAAIPSGLMLSTSLHLTTDIVAMPLLWVLPLGLYLISFSIAFAGNRTIADAMVRLAPVVLLVGAGVTFASTARQPYVYAALGLLTLLVVATALHSEMFARRPDPRHLTRFYLAMSAGGVLGGLFCALIAPLIFNRAYEHPILLVAAAALIAQRPIVPAVGQLFGDSFWGTRLRRWLPVLAFGLSLVAADLAIGRVSNGVMMLCVGAIFIAALLLIGNRLSFAIGVAALMLSYGGWPAIGLSAQPGVMTRSYFGIYTTQTSAANYRNLVHGTTIHGVQNLGSDARERMTTSYYAPRSGVGLAMAAAPQLFGARARVGVVGLGAGTLACYAKPGQSWSFYEIDPVMVTIARDPKRFSFLAKCAPDAAVRVGDARIVLEGERAASVDLLAIDAFSSDAVPMHLLTQEAFASYRRKLAPSGLLLVHISNRFVDLEPVLAAASAQGWVSLLRDYTPSEAETSDRMTASTWVAMSPKRATIDRLRASAPAEPWRSLRAQPGFTGWSDDYGSILPLLKSARRD